MNEETLAFYSVNVRRTRSQAFGDNLTTSMATSFRAARFKKLRF